MTHPLDRHLPLLLATLLAATAAGAQDQPAPDAPAAPPPAAGGMLGPGRLLADARRYLPHLSDIFGSDLPELDRPYAIKLTLRPHFGDLIHRDYMRVETGLRWAMTENFEFRTAGSVFFTHGLKDAAGYGVGQLSGGAKYIFDDTPWRDYETSVELNAETPVGHPPLDMTDGYTHVRQSFVVQHLTDWNPHLTLFGGAGLDFITKSHIPGTPGFNEPRDDSFSLTGGGVYDVGQIKWTFTTTYATTALIGAHADHFLYVQPGLLWYVPRRFTFNTKSQFIMGLGARSTFGPDGSSFSLSSRLRVELTLRQFMDGIRQRTTSSRRGEADEHPAGR